MGQLLMSDAFEPHMEGRCDECGALVAVGMWVPAGGWVEREMVCEGVSRTWRVGVMSVGRWWLWVCGCRLGAG
eukprot:365205-Chlamydomonas_euryale.AAC.11